MRLPRWFRRPRTLFPSAPLALLLRGHRFIARPLCAALRGQLLSDPRLSRSLQLPLLSSAVLLPRRTKLPLHVLVCGSYSAAPSLQRPEDVACLHVHAPLGRTPFFLLVSDASDASAVETAFQPCEQCRSFACRQGCFDCFLKFYPLFSFHFVPNSLFPPATAYEWYL